MNDELIEIRKTLNLSQTEVAEEIGIYQSAISKYEKGKRIPNKRIRLGISNFYKNKFEEEGIDLDLDIYSLFSDNKIENEAGKNRLKDIRQKLYLTVRDAANLTEIGTNTYYRAESQDKLKKETRKKIYNSFVKEYNRRGIEVDFAEKDLFPYIESDEINFTDYELNPDKTSFDRSVVDSVNLALDNLDPIKKEILLLKYFKNLSFQKISDKIERFGRERVRQLNITAIEDVREYLRERGYRIHVS